MTNLEAKAKKIQQSGDYRLTHALERGMHPFEFPFGMARQGIPWAYLRSYHPSDKTIEAYRIGLDTFFRERGIGDLVSAEQVTQIDAPSLQEGFFNMYGTIEDIFYGFERPYHSDKHQNALALYHRLHKMGILGEDVYISYVKGCLTALDVWQRKTEKAIQEAREGTSWLKAETNPETGRDYLTRMDSGSNEALLARGNYINWKMGVLGRIMSKRRDLFDRLENPTKDATLNGFTLEENGKLCFLRHLRQKGELES